MEFKEALAYISGVEKKIDEEYSLFNVMALDERAGRPERKIKMIHLAGTNGKGSVGTFMANMLAASGYRVGRYISPTVIDYRERIQKVEYAKERLSTGYISEDDYAALTKELKAHCDALVRAGYGQPTAFEIETVMAFMMFEKWGVDVAVVEAGIGGRMDATNIIEAPIQCVFTSISIEHEKVLGDSIDKIAREKYGIIKKGTKVVSWKQDTCCELLDEICERKEVPVHYVKKEYIQMAGFSVDKTLFSYKGTDYELKTMGIFQIENAVLAMEAVLQLKESGFGAISMEAINRAMRSSIWKGRCDVVSKQPFVLVDGAHNPDAMERLRETLRVYFPQEKFRFVMGVFQDKDFKQEIQMLLPIAQEFYAVTTMGVRGVCGDSLEKAIRMQAEKMGQNLFIQSCNGIAEALDEISKKEDAVKTVVCGSLSILGDVYRYYSLT